MSDATAARPDGRRRVGLLLPSSNVVIEELIGESGADAPWHGTAFHVARLRVDTISTDERSRRQFQDGVMLRAADVLADAEIEAMVWAGTAGFWLGLEHDRALSQRLSTALRRPATTATLAFLAACRSRAARRLAIVTPFLPAIGAKIASTLVREGFEVVSEAHFGVEQSRRMADLPAATVDAAIKAALAREPDAIGCICTNMRVAASWFAPSPAAPVPIIDTARASLAAGAELARQAQSPSSHQTGV